MAEEYRKLDSSSESLGDCSAGKRKKTRTGVLEHA